MEGCWFKRYKKITLDYENFYKTKTENKTMPELKKDPNIKPIDENLSATLGKSFTAYKTLCDKLPDFEATLEWC